MKKLLSVILAIIMLLGILPMEALADELREEPVRLTDAALPGMDFEKGMPYAGFASGEVNLPERGLYTLTLRRTGDLRPGSAVTVSTVDISAAYGTDYVMADSR